ncbi:MAG TPA: ABC transporter substrate-binding protein [Vicinamibacterales bacterium]|nr:ABC transporter substrate-binding protein [Vicinamibacterales bacterium]
MTPSRILRIVLAVALVIAVIFFVRRSTAPKVSDDGTKREGGRLVASLRQEPRHFNRLMAQDNASRLVALLTQATLVRINPATGELEPRLATEWKGTPDGLTWTFTLRENVRFSDGTPFTAADVLFTFQALYDTRAGSPLGNQIQVAGMPLQFRVLDDHHVVLTFPAPFAAGLTLLDSVPILPRHKLQSALDQGTFGEAWSAGSNVAEIVGLGPFVLKEYRPAQSMRFVRNPNFWLADPSGHRLPYLDEIEVPIITEQNTELLRLQAGESDLLQDAARAEDLAMLRDAERAGKVRLVKAGTSIDVNTFWFNLRAGAKPAIEKPWLTDETFRRALSHAINRQAIVDTVYLGAATVVYGPVTPGHGDWYVPDMGATPFDLARARTLLRSIGLVDRDNDGVLNDAANRPVEFSLLTQRGHTERERTSDMVSEQLRQVGIVVKVSKLEPPSLQERIKTGDFEAVYYGVRSSTTDPATNGVFWNSNGQMHFWNPAQATPSSTWEGRIDELMRQQSTTMDRGERRRMFTEMQQQLADHMPALWFAAPQVNVPISQRVGGAKPSVIAPLVLWDAEHLYVSGGR